MVENNNLMKDAIKELINIINGKYFDYIRKDKIELELTNVIEKGNPLKMIIAYKIASFIKKNNEIYDCIGPLTSSLLAYELGIHNVDTLHYNIDPRMCHGSLYEDEYSIDFRVSNHILKKVINYIKTKLNYGKIYNVYRVNEKDNELILDENKFVLLMNNSFLMSLKEIICNDKTIYCFEDEFVRTHKNDFIIINIFSHPALSAINNLNSNYNKEFSESVESLIKVFKNSYLSTYYLDNIKYLTVEDINDLSFNKLVYLIARNKCLFNDEKKAKSLVTKDAILIALAKSLSDEESINETFKTVYSFDDYLKINDLIDKEELKNVKYAWRLSDIVSLCHRICLCAELCDNNPKKYYETMINYCFSSDDKKCFSFTNENEINSINKLKEMLMEYHINIMNSKVGPFFNIDGIIVGVAESISDHKLNARFINSDIGHFDLFYRIRKPSMKSEYSMYARGRVLYDNEKCLIKVYADRTIIKDNNLKEQIIKKYNLGNYNVVFEKDEHYQILSF